MDDRADLGRTEVREERPRMRTDKDRAVLAGQYTAVGGVAACAIVKLAAGIAPIEVAIDFSAPDPDASQLIAVLHGVVGVLQGIALGLALGGGFGGKVLPLGRFAGGFVLGSLLCGGAGSGLTGDLGGFPAVRCDDDRRRNADAGCQRCRTEGKPGHKPLIPAHACTSRLAR